MTSPQSAGTAGVARPRRRRLKIVSVAILAAIVLAGDISAIVLHQSVTPVSVDSAVRAFRKDRGTPIPLTTSTTTVVASATAADVASKAPRSQPARRGAVTPNSATGGPSAGPSLALPGEGVYVYETTGGERTAPPAPFPPESHSYPAQSTITARAAECGRSYKWAPLAERFDAWNVCPSGDAMRVLTTTEHFEFYNHTDEQTYACTPDSYDFVLPQRSGGTYRASCSSGGSQGTGASGFQINGQVRGVDVLVIGGQTVRAVHLVEQLVANGATSGQTNRERWVDERNGLLIRLVSTSEATSESQVGTVTYHENVSLVLTSLVPQT